MKCGEQWLNLAMTDAKSCHQWRRPVPSTMYWVQKWAWKVLGRQWVKCWHFTLKNIIRIEDVALIKYVMYLLLVNQSEINSLYRRGRLELSLQADWIISHYRFEVIGRHPMLPFTPHSKHVLKNIFHIDRHTVATETPESSHVGPSALWRLQFDFQVIQIRAEIAIVSVAENCRFLLHMANNQEKGKMFPGNKEIHSAFVPPMSYKLCLLQSWNLSWIDVTVSLSE